MKKQSITIRKNSGEVIASLDGYATELAGVPLVVHKEHGGKGWRVSEPKTGMFIGSVGATREIAVENAKRRLGLIITGKSLKEIVDQQVQKLGLDLV